MFLSTCYLLSNNFLVTWVTAEYLRRGEEQNREEGEMVQKKLGGGRNEGKSREEGEKET